MQEAITEADLDSSPRAGAARLVLSSGFQRVVIGLILLNAVTLGLETSASVTEAAGGALQLLDQALLWIFTAGRVDWAEVGARPLILGVVLWIGLLAVHPIAFGVPAVW